MVAEAPSKARKTAVKTARNPGWFKKGLDPRRAHGKKGRSGHPTIELYQKCRGMTFETILPKLKAYIEAGDHDPDDPGFRWAAERIMDRGFGKPTQQVDVAAVDAEGERKVFTLELGG